MRRNGDGQPLKNPFHITAAFLFIMVPMTAGQKTAGYWAGMPTRMKATLIGWSLYWALTAWLMVLGSLFGIAMLLGPILWFIAKSWVLETFLELRGGSGIMNYTLDYIWNGPTFLRSIFILGVLALSLGGLGWLGTEDLRRAESEPTLIERVSETANNVADTTTEKVGAMAAATKTTTKGWVASVKGWFGNDGDETLPNE